MIDYTRYETGPDNDILVFEVHGELDEESSPYLFACVQDEIEEGRTRVVLDFARLNHISSVGLGTLVRIHSRMKNKGGNVQFAHIDGLAAEIVKAVGLNKLFHFHASIEDACKALTD